MSRYSDSLKHPDWQRKRLELYNRDGFKCRLCEATDNPLNLHHLCYSKTGDWRGVPDKFLLTICEDCHEEIHGFKAPKNDSRISTEQILEVTNIAEELDKAVKRCLTVWKENSKDNDGETWTVNDQILYFFVFTLLTVRAKCGRIILKKPLELPPLPDLKL